MFHVFSLYFLQVFFQFSLNFANGKTETVSITGRQMFARTPWRSKPLFAPMNSCYAKWVNQLHDVCANRSCTQCPWNISYSISFVCVCVRVCVCLLGWLSQLVPQQQCKWLKTTPRCVYKIVRRPCNIPLMAEVNAASNNKWTCEASWRHEAESVQQQVVLQDPASTASKIHSNLTFSVWTWVQYTWSKKALTWLYIEDITSKHRVPAEPLHPACAMRRPAKRRVLTTQRARKAQYDFGCECHPDLQRIGNTELRKGSPSGCRYQSAVLRWTVPFSSWSPAQNLRMENDHTMLEHTHNAHNSRHMLN